MRAPFLRAAAFGLALLLALPLRPAQAQAQVQAKEPLRIGLLLSLSGVAAVYGIPERDAVQVVADSINAKGGVNGRKIELFVYDEATSPTESARGIVDLIQRHKVVAVIGSTAGSGTLAAAPSAARLQVPLLGPNSTISITSKQNAFAPWVFRSMTNDLLNAKVMFESAVSQGAKRIAFFYQEDSMGKETVDYMVTLAKERGVEVVGTASAPLKAVDTVAQATRIRNANPDVIVMQTAPVGLSAGFLRAAKQVGITAPIWGPMSLGYKTFLDNAKDAAEGMRLVLIANWDDPTPGLKELSDLLVAAKKKPEGFAELLTTNGLMAIVAAASKIDAPAITGPALRDQLERVCDAKTFAKGRLCYSPDNHDGWGPDLLVRVVVKDGKFQTLK